MTIEEQIAKIKVLQEKLNNVIADVFTKATLNLKTDMHNRIFDEHEDSSNQKIGQYSVIPILVGAKSFVGSSYSNAFFSGLKKDKENKENKEDKESHWKTVRGHHLYQLAGGYKELRTIQGRPVNEVNLYYRGELSEKGMTTITDRVYQVKFADKLSENKGRGYEEKHGKKIFYASEPEKKKTLEFINTKILEGFKECFG